MPFDAQNYEYLKNNFHLKRELVADSRDKIIRHSHIKKKFHKPKFDEAMRNPEYKQYIDDLLERAMVKDMRGEDFDIDADSYEEVRSIAIDLDSELIDPEA